MATDRQACGFANRPIWRASALLAAAFFIGGVARAETGSRPGEVTSVAPGAILDRRAVDPPPMPRQAKTESSRRGNPLWAVPLEALADTRARPIFSPSRRPPSPPVVASPPPPPPPKPASPVEPDRLKLTLLGTVIGTSDRLGVFLDETSKEVIRIRTGASHDGWTLSSVQPGAASFEKNRQEMTLKFPLPGSERPASGVGVVAARPGGVSVSGNGGAVNPADNRARAAALTIPASPTAPSAHKVRQEIRRDILSIGVQN
jgi:general secretion pathway protein N